MAKKQNNADKDIFEHYQSGDTFHVYVTPNAPSNIVCREGERIHIRLKAKAMHNQANESLLQLMKKIYNISVCIVSGHNSRKKMLRIL